MNRIPPPQFANWGTPSLGKGAKSHFISLDLSRKVQSGNAQSLELDEI